MRSIKILWEKQDGKCYFCKQKTFLREPDQKKNSKCTATREHLIPKSQGGSNRVANIKMSCHYCNTWRGNMCAILWLNIVNDKFRLAAFHRVNKLKKKITKIRNQKRRDAKRLEKRGYLLNIIYLPPPQFNQIFKRCA